ncbi:Ig-like domain-containing protein [Pelotomaculum terephthalicicum JT]|uniref:major tail protein n=1 Tax=Pelotomaculum terephthalicicum TaxID=206393 RepID=UPI001F04936D|nr:major tail protein [Pelotomaculum terephthalicicum]MCG9967531.1 Ig-like domain-containing protein [Pelotomaculum terephthalicicum JT]
MAGVQVGLNSLYYAVLTSDTPLGATYNSPVAIAGAINAKISPKSNTETLYCDDGPDETVTSLGEIDVEFEAKDIDLNTQAALLGHSVTGGVLVKKSTDTAPYVALGFKSKKSNGSYRYVWLYKGKFALQEQEYQTAEDKPKFQTPKIKGTFIKRTFDNAWQKIGDEDHPDWAVSTGINWFTAVDGAAPGPLTVIISPVDGSSGVAADANLTWTFANAIQATDVTAANFILLKADDGSLVAGVLSINSEHKVVTFNPASNLAPGADYIMVCTQGVRDICGQNLANASIGSFTTAV